MSGVTVRGLTKRFGARVILDAVDLDARPGDLALVAGRSGSGKSTLLAILAGLEPRSSGMVEVAGAAVHELDAEALRLHRLRQVGIVFQDYRLIPDLTVAENVRLPLTLAGVKRAEERVGRLLEQVDLAARARAFPESLSGGEQQRVAVARALANDPAVVLADEPTANLDEDNARRILEILAGIARLGRTVVVASHDPLAAPYATRAWRVHAGRLEPLTQRPTVVTAQRPRGEPRHGQAGA